MDMQQPPTLDFDHPHGVAVASDLLRQERETARKSIENQLLSSMAVKDAQFNKSSLDKGGSPQEISNLFRQAQQGVKNSMQKEKGGMRKALEVAAAPIQMGTSKLLQQAWINLIDSFGATLIWINIHVFLRLVFGESFFVKLGHEWMSKAGGKGAGATKGAGAESGQLMDELTEGPQKALGLVEAAGVAFLDLIVLFALLLCVVQIAFLIYVISSPLEAGLDLITGTLSAPSL
jgi:hypothetical protein